MSVQLPATAPRCTCFRRMDRSMTRLLRRRVRESKNERRCYRTQLTSSFSRQRSDVCNIGHKVCPGSRCCACGACGRRVIARSNPGKSKPEFASEHPSTTQVSFFRHSCPRFGGRAFQTVVWAASLRTGRSHSCAAFRRLAMMTELIEKAT